MAGLMLGVAPATGANTCSAWMTTNSSGDDRGYAQCSNLDSGFKFRAALECSPYYYDKQSAWSTRENYTVSTALCQYGQYAWAQTARL